MTSFGQADVIELETMLHSGMGPMLLLESIDIVGQTIGMRLAVQLMPLLLVPMLSSMRTAGCVETILSDDIVRWLGLVRVLIS